MRTGKDSVDFNRVRAVVISYDLIKNEKFHFDYKVVIVDESHYLKNTRAKRTANVSGRQMAVSGFAFLTPAVVGHCGWLSVQ